MYRYLSSGFSRFVKPGLVAAGLLAVSAPTIAHVAGPDAVHAIVHVDIDPDRLSVGQPLLQRYAGLAARDAAVSHFELLQQSDAPNHFTLVEVFPSLAAYHHFVEEAYVRQLRSDIQPLLGSPFDERLHHALSALDH
ncbi:putative quinol monooxygenase [Frateuria aurantia]